MIPQRNSPAAAAWEAEQKLLGKDPERERLLIFGARYRWLFVLLPALPALALGFAGAFITGAFITGALWLPVAALLATGLLILPIARARAWARNFQKAFYVAISEEAIAKAYADGSIPARLHDDLQRGYRTHRKEFLDRARHAWRRAMWRNFLGKGP